MIIVSFFLIGGCNNSGSNQVDARTIGDIEGAVVSALKQELTLRNWEEGDPDGDLYLNGSRVATLTDAEKQAINDSYDMGFIVALINPDIDHILDLHEVLGLNPVFADNGTLDLLAFSREFNVSGIRYFMMRHHSEVGNPIPPNLNRDRVIALGEWAPVASSASTASSELRGTGAIDFTKIADSTSHHQFFTYHGEIDPPLAQIDPSGGPDMLLTLTGFVQTWSVHSFSSVPPSDFYYLRANYSFTPSTRGTLGAVCNGICGVIPFSCSPAPDATGVGEYTMTNFQTAFPAPEILNIISSPNTTIGEMTTTNSVDHTISENVSYSQDDGAEVGASNSVSVSHSTSFSTPSVTTTKFIGLGPNKNNAEWDWSICPGQTCTSTRATFSPNFQWIWQAEESTRASGSILWQQQFTYRYFPYSCFSTFVATSSEAPLKLAIPIPPLPTTCTTKEDCGVGQVCATDFTPSVCAAEACDESMVCPAGFECLNEVCEPLS